MSVLEGVAGAAGIGFLDANYLRKDQNLADLTSIPDARTNLGLGTLALVDDAPSNGNQYARQNGSWAVVAAGAVTSVFGRTGAIVAVAGDYTATLITNTPAGNIAATTVQGAINELDSEKQPISANLTNLASLSKADGNFIVGDGTDWVVENGATVRNSLGLGTIATFNDAPSDGNQYARKNGAWDIVIGNVSSVFGRTGAVVAVAGDYTASLITNVATGNISATNVQAAINELDAEKQPLDATLTALASFNSNGFIVQTALDTFVARSIIGTLNQVNVANGDGGSANPILSLPQNIHTGATPTFAGLSVNGGLITNVATPVSNTDAATKAYVDAISQGLDIKNSVRVATTVAGTLVSSFENGDVIDGITLVTGDRILIKNQATASENGIYVINASGAPTRASDFDQNIEVTAGAFTFVEEGTTNEDSGWVLTTNNPIIVGTTSLNFAQFSGAGQINAGAGLTKTGNTLDVVGTADRITVNADSVDIASTYAGQASIITLGTITTGVWQGTPVAVGFGGTGASTQLAARANLGLAIGVDVQAYDGTLAAFAALSGTADTIAYFTGAEPMALTALTAFGRSLIGAADKAALAPLILPVVDEQPLVHKTGSPAITQTHNIDAYSAARVVTWPDQAGTVALLERAQTFSAAQIIDVATDVVPLTLEKSGSQTANIFQTRDSTGTVLTNIDKNGRLTIDIDANVSPVLEGKRTGTGELFFYFGGRNDGNFFSGADVASNLGSILKITGNIKRESADPFTDVSIMRIDATINPTAGAATHYGLKFAPVVNQTGTASGDITIFSAEPTLTSVLGTLRFFEFIDGGNRVFEIGQQGNTTIRPVDAATNSINNAAIFSHNSTGTPIAGFGTGLLFQGESGSGGSNDQSMGRLTWEWVDPTHATRTARGKLSAFYTSTEREAIRWEATSSTSLITLTGTTTSVGPVNINANSTAALRVEQDGVKDNVLVVDTENGWVGVNTIPEFPYHLVTNTASQSFAIRNSVGNNNGTQFRLGFSRGTPSSPSDIVNGDSVFVLGSEPYSGGTWFNTSSIASTVDGTFTSGQAPPTGWVISTNLANNSATSRMKIKAIGPVIMAGNVDLITTALGQLHVEQQQTSFANKVALYVKQSDPAELLFRGDIPAGTVASISGAGLAIHKVIDAITTGVTTAARFGHGSSGQPDTGFGTAIELAGESGTGGSDDQDMARIASIWNTATHASRSADLVFYIVHSAAALAEAGRIKSDGNWLLGKTNQALFNVSGLTAGRTFTFPDAAGTVALLERAQTFTVAQTISGSAAEMLLVRSSNTQSTNFVVENTTGTRVDFFVNGSNNPGFFGAYDFTGDTTPFVIQTSNGFFWLRRDAQYVWSNDPTYADAGTPDTGLERFAAGKVGVTNGSTGVGSLLASEVEIDGDLNHDGSNIGLFGTAPTTKKTVTGSRGGNAALQSLLTALAAYGLITDSTS